MKKKSLHFIGINDLWLTLYFAALIINMFISLLFPLTPAAEKAGLDIAMRTATAVLAGYFVSKGFTEKKNTSPPLREEKTRKNFQSIVVAAVGTAALCIMIVVRYAESVTFSAASLSQVRDLYLASVAFLMGTS